MLTCLEAEARVAGGAGLGLVGRQEEASAAGLQVRVLLHRQERRHLDPLEAVRRACSRPRDPAQESLDGMGLHDRSEFMFAVVPQRTEATSPAETVR